MEIGPPCVIQPSLGVLASCFAENAGAVEPPPLVAARLTITTAAITTAAPTSSSTRRRRRSGASKRCIVSPLRLAYVPRQRRVRPADPSSHGSDDSPRGGAPDRAVSG